MYDFTLTQEFDWIAYIGVIRKAQDIVIRFAGFLFCCKILEKIRNRIALGLKFTGIQRNSSCCLRPDTCCMINIIGSKSGIFNFLRGQISCQLMNNRSDNFKMSQFLCSYII